MCSQFCEAINNAAGTYIDNHPSDFEDTFAPVPLELTDEWLLNLINLVGLELTAAAAPFFDGGKSQLASFRQ